MDTILFNPIERFAMQLFEVTVRGEPSDMTLLVVAADEAEARVLAGARGAVRAVEANHGPFTIRGASRVIGDVQSNADRQTAH